MRNAAVYKGLALLAIVFAFLYAIVISMSIASYFLDIRPTLPTEYTNNFNSIYLVVILGSSLSFLLWLFVSFSYSYNLGGFRKPKIFASIVAMIIPVVNIVVLYYMINELLIRLINKDYTTPLAKLPKHPLAICWLALFCIFWVISFIDIMMNELRGPALIAIIMVSVVLGCLLQVYLLFTLTRLLKVRLQERNSEVSDPLYESLITR
jgi:hypothetical protein